MTRTEIEVKVKGILNEQFGLTNDMIQSTSKLSADLNADSLDVVEIIMACEQEFEIEIDDPAFEEKDLTYDELVALIEKKVT